MVMVVMTMMIYACFGGGADKNDVHDNNGHDDGD
jgi:hypothetical protein